MSEQEWYEENRQSWNSATVQHNSHKGDQAVFFEGGGSNLFADEIELLGDVRGKQLLHLQCNAGQDSLSIASQLGAEVTGVDISDEAIEFAQNLAQESGIAVENEEPFENPNPCNEFAWGLADIVMALVNAGLRISTMKEYPHSNGYKPYPQLLELPGRRFVFDEDMPEMPLMYGIVAEKDVSQ
jgi:SAM-dependent methyltransferase